MDLAGVGLWWRSAAGRKKKERFARDCLGYSWIGDWVEEGCCVWRKKECTGVGMGDVCESVAKCRS